MEAKCKQCDGKGLVQVAIVGWPYSAWKLCPVCQPLSREQGERAARRARAKARLASVEIGGGA